MDERLEDMYYNLPVQELVEEDGYQWMKDWKTSILMN